MCILLSAKNRSEIVQSKMLISEIVFFEFQKLEIFVQLTKILKTMGKYRTFSTEFSSKFHRKLTDFSQVQIFQPERRFMQPVLYRDFFAYIYIVNFCHFFVFVKVGVSAERQHHYRAIFHHFVFVFVSF